jgi:hypothetical protein
MNHRVALLLVLMFASCGGDDTASKVVGAEGGPCLSNNTCNAGLTCASQLCVRLPTNDASQADTSGTGSALDGVPSGLVIVQNQSPEYSALGCVVPNKASSVRAISGIYDVDLDRPYPFYAYPLIRNELPKTASDSTIESNRIEYTGVEVKIVSPEGVVLPSTAACPTEFSFPDRASVSPGEDVGSAVQVFLPCHSAALLAMFNYGALPAEPSAEIRFEAVVRATARHAATMIKSAPFEFSVRVCRGCLQRGYQGEFSVFDYPGVPACTSLKTNPYPGNACNPAQDALILCCSKDPGTSQLVCPAQAVTPP